MTSLIMFAARQQATACAPLALAARTGAGHLVLAKGFARALCWQSSLGFASERARESERLERTFVGQKSHFRLAQKMLLRAAEWRASFGQIDLLFQLQVFQAISWERLCLSSSQEH